MAFGKRKLPLNHAPIENRSLFSVKKRVPNPRVPEPSRMLLRQKFECKSFLILMPTISQIYCSSANSLSRIATFLLSLHGESNSRTSGDGHERRNYSSSFSRILVCNVKTV